MIKKYDGWFENLQHGDSHYQGILQEGTGWYYVLNNEAYRIRSLRLTAVSVTGQTYEYAYTDSADRKTGGDDESNDPFTVLIKDEQKLILKNGERYLWFGMWNTKRGECSDSKIVALKLYARTEGLHTWIYAHKGAENVELVCASVDESPEAITLCMDELEAVSEQCGATIKEVRV
jgi:hypothetical protein